MPYGYASSCIVSSIVADPEGTTAVAIFIEVLLVAMAIDGIFGIALATMGEALAMGVGGFVVVVGGVALFSSYPIAHTDFGAAHAHLILLTQLAVLVAYPALIVGYWDAPGIKGKIGPAVGLGVVTGLIYWVFAYWQSFFMAQRIGEDATRPAFYDQLNLHLGAYNDTDVSSAQIRTLTLGKPALLAGLVMFVVMAVAVAQYDKYKKARTR